MKPEHTACTSKAAPRVMPSRAWIVGGGGGNVSSGVVVAHDDEIEFVRADAGIGERGARGLQREIGRLLARRHDMALRMPVRSRIHSSLVSTRLARSCIGEDGLRQIRAAAENMRTDHEATAFRSGRHDTGAVGDDALDDAGLGHVDGHVERAGKAEGIGAAMAFHHHAVQAQENPAIGGARIELAAQRFERAARQHRAKPRQQRTPERAAQKIRSTSLAVPSAVFSAILPVKPSVTTTSTVPLAISSPSTKPSNSIGSEALRRIWAAALHRVVAL